MEATQLTNNSDDASSFFASIASIAEKGEEDTCFIHHLVWPSCDWTTVSMSESE